MKKLLILLLLLTIPVLAQDTFFYPMSGTWQPSEDPLLIQEFGFQNVQNVRPDGNRYKSISGQTKITTSAINATEKYPKSAYHFKKDSPNAETHVIVQSATSNWSSSKIYQNTTAIPGAGNFSATTLHTDGTTNAKGIFSPAPRGSFIYTNGVDTKIWSGDEMYPTRFIVSESAPRDYTSAITNDLTHAGNLATIQGGWGNNSDTILLMHFDGIEGDTQASDASVGGDHGLASTTSEQGQAPFLQEDPTKFGVTSSDTNAQNAACANNPYCNAYWYYADHADWDLFASDIDFTIDAWIYLEEDPADTGAGANIAFHREDGDNFWQFFVFDDAGSINLKFKFEYGGTPKEIIPAADFDTGDFTLGGADYATGTPDRVVLTDSDTVTVTDLDLDEEAYVYETFGLDFINGSFVYYFSVNCTEDTEGIPLYPWMVSNEIAAKNDISGDAIYLKWEIKRVRLQEMKGGALSADSGVSVQLSLSTTYYFKIQRDENIGSFGTVYCWIYTGSQGGTLVDLLTLDLTEKEDFKYLYWLNSYNFGGSGGQEWSGVIEAYQKRPASLSLNTWYHVAVIRGWGGNTETMAIAIDGIATTFDVTSWGNDSFTGNLRIGAFFYGNIDELRITKNAIWTKQFTPPDRPYGSDDGYFLVGSPRLLQGIKAYVETANTESGAAITGQYWDESAWTSLGGFTDNTSGFDATGTITFNTNPSEVKYYSGHSLYWYRFYMDIGEAVISELTVDAPFQNISNVWDASYEVVSACKKYDAGATPDYIDYSDEVNDDATTTVAVFDALAVADYILLGFTIPQQGFGIYFPPGEENENSVTATVRYSGGNSWKTVSGLIDGTSGFSETGFITFQSIEPGLEFKIDITDELPLYYYRIDFSGVLSASVDVYYVIGISAPQKIYGHDVSAMFQGRAFLFKGNKAIYSMYNTPDVWNGWDSGELTFGPEGNITAATTLYNVYGSDSVAQMIVTKQSETYRVFGDGPENFRVQQISPVIGCPAPLSLVTCSLGDKQVVIWQSASGVMMSDGASITDISHDIRCYFDPHDSRYIPADRIADSYGWWDSGLQAYKLLISSGSGQTTHNVELEYSIPYDKWTKNYREKTSPSEIANPLQIGLEVADTDGQRYSYGLTDEGFMYRLENGLDFEDSDTGTPKAGIEQILHTKDFLLGDFMHRSLISFFRLGFEDKGSTATEDISIAHYCDQVLTTDGVGGQFVPRDIDTVNGPYESTDCVLGHCLIHSFELSAETHTVTDGMEITGIGLSYEISSIIEE